MAVKPLKPVNSWGFHGMNNLPREPADYFDTVTERRVTPRILLNALVNDSGAIRPRQGITKLGDTGLHSLWAGSVMLGVGSEDNVLYLINGASLDSLATLPDITARMQYAEVDGVVYMASPYWTGVYDLKTQSMRSWGVPVPDAPRVSLCPGDLPPGTYTLGYTRTADGRMSGNGPLVQVSWEGSTQSIRLSNIPADGQVWITHPNGKKLLLAALNGDTVVGQVPQGEPLLPFMVRPAPLFDDFAHAFGRIWGVRGRNLHYSFPGVPDWFRYSDFIPFLEPLVMVAPISDGLFVHSLKSTWHLEGKDPAKMAVTRIGTGAIPGTLVYAPMPASLAGGAATSASFGSYSIMPSPVWLSPTGFVVGTHSGHLTQLTEHQVRLAGRKHGGSVFYMEGGVPRIIASLYGQPIGDFDEEIDEIFIRGSIF